MSYVIACTLARCVRVPATAPHRSVIGIDTELLRSGVFHAASWGHHDVGRVAIVAFLAISTVLLFVSPSSFGLCTVMDPDSFIDTGASH